MDAGRPAANALGGGSRKMIRDYIDGKWVASSAKASVPIVNPATGQELESCPLGTAADADRAVKAAQAAFAAWKNVPVIDRVQYLFKLKPLMEANVEELARLVTQEHGKTLVEARGRRRRGIQMVETACGHADSDDGQDSRGHRFRHRLPGDPSSPMGVFAGIAPFNFPAMVPFWFWPFAVAAGNTFVLKPTERVPLTSVRIFELMEKVGFPKGVMNLVNGGKEVVNALCTHPDVVGVSFVGSTPVAKHVYTLGTSHGKRVAGSRRRQKLHGRPARRRDGHVREDGSRIHASVARASAAWRARSSSPSATKLIETVTEGMVRYAKDTVVGDGLDQEHADGPADFAGFQRPREGHDRKGACSKARSFSSTAAKTSIR